MLDSSYAMCLLLLGVHSSVIWCECMATRHTVVFELDLIAILCDLWGYCNYVVSECFRLWLEFGPHGHLPHNIHHSQFFYPPFRTFVHSLIVYAHISPSPELSSESEPRNLVILSMHFLFRVGSYDCMPSSAILSKYAWLCLSSFTDCA